MLFWLEDDCCQCLVLLELSCFCCATRTSSSSYLKRKGFRGANIVWKISIVSIKIHSSCTDNAPICGHCFCPLASGDGPGFEPDPLRVHGEAVQPVQLAEAFHRLEFTDSRQGNFTDRHQQWAGLFFNYDFKALWYFLNSFSGNQAPNLRMA